MTEYEKTVAIVAGILATKHEQLGQALYFGKPRKVVVDSSVEVAKAIVDKVTAPRPLAPMPADPEEARHV